MTRDDLNVRVREDGCLFCDDINTVLGYIDQHDVLVARVAELEKAVAEALPLCAAGSERIQKLEDALRLIARSSGFKGGTTVSELQSIARNALKENS